MLFSPGTDIALDAALQRWAERHSLPAAKAEAIRQAVRGEQEGQPAALPYEWWGRFFGDLTASLRESADAWRGPKTGIVPLVGS